MALTPRDAYLRRTYGITEAQYAEVLEHQGGRCAICHRKPAAGKNLHVDHDHRAGGVVRGVLCMPCNHDVLGRRDGDPGLFRRAAEYLESPPAVAALGPVVPPTRKPKKRKPRSGNNKRIR